MADLNLPVLDRELRRLDASNRAVRTLLQGFVFDVAVSVLLVLAAAFGDATGFGDIRWDLIAFSVVKSLILSALSYLQRMKTSLLPPPNPQPEPNVDVPSEPA